MNHTYPYTHAHMVQTRHKGTHAHTYRNTHTPRHPCPQTHTHKYIHTHTPSINNPLAVQWYPSSLSLSNWFKTHFSPQRLGQRVPVELKLQSSSSSKWTSPPRSSPGRKAWAKAPPLPSNGEPSWWSVGTAHQHLLSTDIDNKCKVK